jgi:2,4-dienoyl-CoA reductase (NADPH2)
MDVRPFTALESLDEESAVLRNTMAGTADRVAADTVIVVGECVARDWRALVPRPRAGTTATPGPGAAGVRVIGDALVPRKASHAIAEGREAAESILGTRPRAAAIAGTA